jgi:hypothetical protein
MNCWEQLGIEPTSDLERIKKAFASQSRFCHPEDDPDGFQRLRTAYQQALGLARLISEGLLWTSISEDITQEEASAAEVSPAPAPAEALSPAGAAASQSPSVIENGYLRVDPSLDFGLADHTAADEEHRKPHCGIAVTAAPPATEIKQEKIIPSPSKLFRYSYTRLIIVLFIVMTASIGMISDFGVNSSNETVKAITPAVSELTQTILDGIVSDARDVLAREADDRRLLLRQIKADMPYDQATAALGLGLTENEYRWLVSTYQNSGEEPTVKSLEQYRPNEEAFVEKQILPFLKRGMQQDNTSLLYTKLARLVGIDPDVFNMIHKNYLEKHDEEVLDTFLQYHNELQME